MKTWIAGMMMVAGLILGLATEGNASSIRYDVDRTVDFSTWKNVAWKVTPPTVSMPERRIRQALKAGFEGRGYTFVETPLAADFIVSYRAAAWGEVEVSGAWYGPGFGRHVQTQRVPKGVLIVEVFERATGRLAWHGSVSDDLASDADKADERTMKAVAKLLKKFPARVMSASVSKTTEAVTISR